MSAIQSGTTGRKSDAPGPGVTRYLTRSELVEYLRAYGYPMTLSTLNKKCMASSRDEGPPHEGWWGRGWLYDPVKALRWARSQLRNRRAGD
jgi:hypothetical protein